MEVDDTTEEAAPAPGAGGSPTDFLARVLGSRVRVRLNSGIEYRGTLGCLDGFMNLALEHATEWAAGRPGAQYKDAFIRGNNVYLAGHFNVPIIRSCISCSWRRSE